MSPGGRGCAVGTSWGCTWPSAGGVPVGHAGPSGASEGVRQCPGRVSKCPLGEGGPGWARASSLRGQTPAADGPRGRRGGGKAEGGRRAATRRGPGAPSTAHAARVPVRTARRLLRGKRWVGPRARGLSQPRPVPEPGATGQQRPAPPRERRSEPPRAAAPPRGELAVLRGANCHALCRLRFSPPAPNRVRLLVAPLRHPAFRWVFPS